MNTNSEMQPLLLKGAQVAEALGISRALAYRWMSGGILPTVRVSKVYSRAARGAAQVDRDQHAESRGGLKSGRQNETAPTVASGGAVQILQPGGGQCQYRISSLASRFPASATS